MRDDDHSLSVSSTQDLAAEELEEVARRLHRVLGRFEAMSFHALAYRIGEVGSKRVDQKKLRRALKELSNNKRPRRGKTSGAGVKEDSGGIFASLDLPGRDFARAAACVTDALTELTTCSGPQTVQEFAESLCAEIPDLALKPSPIDLCTCQLADGVEFRSATCTLLHRPRKGATTAVLISHQPDWLYPDDKALWRFLIDVGRNQTNAIVVARAVAPGTFPLLKSLGIIGIQYYATLVDDGSLARAETLRTVTAWSHLQSSRAIAKHRFVDHLRRTLERFAGTVPNTERNSILAAVAQHPALSTNPTVADVLRWWDESGLALPAPVVTGWSRWVAWDSYNRGSHKTAKTIVPHTRSPSAHETPAANPAASAPRGFGRETHVIPVGLSLSLRDYKAILDRARRASAR